jgi:hypothetical protein
LFAFSICQGKTSIGVCSYESLERRLVLERNDEYEILLGFSFDLIVVLDGNVLK